MFKSGDMILSLKYNYTGTVKEGHWINVGITSRREGDGLYVCWDDGDRSCVPIESLKEGEYKLIPKEEERYYS
jgi:hypothetical protein